MPIQAMNFAGLPVQGDPGARGSLDALMKGMQAGLMPFQARQQLKQQQIANALAQNQLQYAPQMAQADLSYKQAQTPYLQAQTDLMGQQAQYYAPNIKSEMAQRGAQTNLTSEQAKYLPLDYLIRGTQTSNTGGRFGAAYELSRALQQMPKATREQWIADNQQQYTDMVNTLADKTAQAKASAPQNMLADALAQTFPQYNKLPQSAAQSNALDNGNPSQFAVTPEEIKRLKMASEISANNSLVTGKTRNQLEGAIQVSSVMNDPEFQSKAMNASLYAGALGKGKSALAALSQTNPKAYEDYLSFKNQDMVLLLNRIKMLDGMGATDSQRIELNDIYHKTLDSMTSNPAQFITQLNNLGGAIDRVGKAVVKSARPLGGGNPVEGYKPIGGAVMKFNSKTGKIE